MKVVLIVIGIIIVVLINFVLYCCLRVASKTDQLYEKLSISKKEEQKKWNEEIKYLVKIH